MPTEIKTEEVWQLVEETSGISIDSLKDEEGNFVDDWKTRVTTGYGEKISAVEKDASAKAKAEVDAMIAKAKEDWSKDVVPTKSYLQSVAKKYDLEFDETADRKSMLLGLQEAYADKVVEERLTKQLAEKLKEVQDKPLDPKTTQEFKALEIELGELRTKIASHPTELEAAVNAAREEEQTKFQQKENARKQELETISLVKAAVSDGMVKDGLNDGQITVYTEQTIKHFSTLSDSRGTHEVEIKPFNGELYFYKKGTDELHKDAMRNPVKAGPMLRDHMQNIYRVKYAAIKPKATTTTEPAKSKPTDTTDLSDYKNLVAKIESEKDSPKLIELMSTERDAERLQILQAAATRMRKG